MLFASYPVTEAEGAISPVKKLHKFRTVPPLLVALLAFQLTSGGSDRTVLQPVLAHSPSRAAVDYSLHSYLNSRNLYLRSGSAVVVDEIEGRVLYEKNIKEPRPIASLTKLMTAMAVLDSGLPEDEVITIKKADRDRLRGSRSKLSFGTKLTRRDLLKIALAGSENRATAALGRTYPGGTDALVTAMNRKARALGMKDSSFRDPSGLHSKNVSTPADLVKLVDAAMDYPLIRKFTTLGKDFVTDRRSGWKVEFMNTNRLVRNRKWDVEISKTGYIAASGHCLVMRAEIAGRPLTLVLLNSWGTLSKYGDANRIRKWIESADRKARAAADSAEETASR